METAKIATICLTAISIGLLVGGFFCPPMGVIDGSVLQATGILLAFAALWVVAHAINERGAHATYEKGDTRIEIDTTEDDDENDDMERHD